MTPKPPRPPLGGYFGGLTEVGNFMSCVSFAKLAYTWLTLDKIDLTWLNLAMLGKNWQKVKTKSTKKVTNSAKRLQK